MARELKDLTPAEVKGLSREKTLFFICTSPLSDMGDHLNLGVRMATSVGLAQQVARKLEGQGLECVLLPPLPLGVSSANTHLSLLVRPHVLRDAIVDQCQSLHRLGFKWFICFSSERSPQQLTAIEEAGKFLSSRTAGWSGWTGRWVERLPGVSANRAELMSADSALIERKELWRAPMWPDPEEVGGDIDTSRALALSPGQVRADYTSRFMISPNPSRWARLSSWWKNEAQGHRGDPSQAHATKGIELVQAESDLIAAKVRAVLDGSPAHVVFRSGFSLFPTNSSIFWVWIMTVSLFLLLLSWLFWAVQWMTQGIDL